MHGPIMNGLLTTLSSQKPIAMSWIYTQQKNQILQAVHALSHSKNVNDFYNGVSLIHAPGLNVMYGDAQNNIAWITSGKLYKLDKSVNGNFIMNGANGIDDKKNFCHFQKSFCYKSNLELRLFLIINQKQLIIICIQVIIYHKIEPKELTVC